MKLFIVAFCLLLAVTNGFQPLLSTKSILSKASPAKTVYDPRPKSFAAIKKIVVKQVAPKKSAIKTIVVLEKVATNNKKTAIKKTVVKSVAPAKKTVTIKKPPLVKLVVDPTAPAKKIAKKMIVGPEKKRTLKFFYDKL
jgi:hypothetical protein